MRHLGLLPLVLAAACAGAPPAPRDPAARATSAGGVARAAAPEPAAEAQVAAQPVAAPEGLTAVLRVADAQRTWGNVMQLFAGTPLGLLLVGPGQMAPDLLLEEAVGPALANVVDLGGRVDAVVIGTSGPRFVFSLPVPEREVPRLQDRFVLKEQRGMLRVEGVRGGDPEDQRLPMACSFEQGERSGSARLLCAEDPRSLDAAAPYLVQVVGREPLEADARVEIQLSSLRDEIEKETRADEDEDEGHAAKMGRELGDSFVRDLEGMSLDLTWAGADVEAALGLRFAARRSPLSLALAPATAADAPAPPAFFRLPRDTALAFYTQGASRAELAPLRARFFKAMRDDMVDDGYDGARLDAFLERLGSLALTGGPLVLGAGGDRAAVDKALAAYHQGGKPQARHRDAARRALQGWMLAAVEEPAGPWVAGIKELIRLGEELDRHKAPASPAGAAAAGGAPKADAKKKKDDDDKERTDPVIVRAPASLPAGTLHVELRTRPLTKDAPPAHTNHLYVVPAGQRTWIGVGEDDAAVVERLRIAVEPGRDERTLGAAPGLEALRQRGALAGGFSSLAGMALLAASGDTPEEIEEAASDLAGLASLPARGETAIPVAITSEVLGSGAARVSLRLRLPGPVIQDALALILR